jgi:hypothetical protein
MCRSRFAALRQCGGLSLRQRGDRIPFAFLQRQKFSNELADSPNLAKASDSIHRDHLKLPRINVVPGFRWTRSVQFRTLVSSGG